MSLDHNRKVLRELLVLSRENRIGRPITDSEFNKAIEETKKAERRIKLLIVLNIIMMSFIVTILYIFYERK